MRSKVIVVVANRMLLEDLEGPGLPTIGKMLRQGAVGLMSPNCSGPKSESSVLLTANAGSPARGGWFVRESYDAGEITRDGMPAGEAYAVRTGHKAPKGSAVFLGLGQALRENLKQNTAPAKLGALGDALHAAGLKTAVFGNADRMIPGKDRPVDRSAAALAMDSRGIVDYGALAPANEFGATMARSRPAPTGKGDRHHPDPLLRGEGENRGDLTVIYFGELTRLDEEKMSMTDAALAAQRAAALHKLDRLLRELTTEAPTKAATVILASFSPPYGPSWDQLTPLVIYPSKNAGLLTSATTRTPAIIGAADFAPTVLRLMNVKATQEMIGRPATVVPNPLALAVANEIGPRVTTNQRLLLPVGVSLAVLGVLSFTGAAVVIAFGLKPSRRVLGLLRIGLVASACIGGALYLAPLAPAGAVWYIAGTGAALVLLAGISATVGGWVSGFKRSTAERKSRNNPVRALPVICAFGLTSAVIVVDALTGCNLCKWCAASSYQLSGMRYYGIGNEFAGLLIGMLAPVALYLRDRRWLTPALGVVVALSLGLGQFGANYGAVPCTVVTFALLWMAITGGRFGARHVLFAFALSVVAAVGLALADFALAGPSGTHAAEAASLTEKLGSGYIASVALRKVLFNMKTTFTSTGPAVMLGFSPFLALWFWRLRDKVRNLFKDDPRMMAGVKAILVGSMTAYVLEDSGIVFASIIIAMTVLVLLYSLVEELNAAGMAPSPQPSHPGEGEGKR